ncbi:MAG TPA: type VI secretion system lipoprotein TssJ, partial [Planctomycetota bacterium]|nr:type VI secretion system lipoprotein TssJ [Planctomycetota bacterium]
MRVNWMLLGALLAAAAAAGCSATEIYLRGVRPLNVNSRGESTPVIVRVYKLSDPQAFSNATLEQLWVNNDLVKHVM